METANHITPLLKVRDVANLLHVHEMTVRRWSDQGILKALRIASRGDRRFRHDDICRFKDEMRANLGHVKKINMHWNL